MRLGCTQKWKWKIPLLIISLAGSGFSLGKQNSLLLVLTQVVEIKQKPSYLFHYKAYVRFSLACNQHQNIYNTLHTAKNFLGTWSNSIKSGWWWLPWRWWGQQNHILLVGCVFSVIATVRIFQPHSQQRPMNSKQTKIMFFTMSPINNKLL